jgi:uncharacterized protein YgiM (DUF1202 family)
MKKGIAMSLCLSAAAFGMAATDSHAQEVGTITASALNIRSGPGTGNSIVGKAYKGQTVTILESKNGWHKVTLSSGTTGWGSGDYIKTGSQSSTPTTASGTGTITASALNIRSGSGTGNSIVGKAYKGQTVTILESQGGWYKVKLSNGTTGWGSGDYIRTGTQSSTPAPTPEVAPAPVESASGTGTITASALNIRSGAGTGYSVVTKAYRGQAVELLASQNGWYKVKLSNGTTGWASGSYVTKGSQAPQESVTEAPSRGTDRSAAINLAYAQMGKSYRWGAEGPSSFDCSGFTTYVYKNALGKSIPRTSSAQSRYGASVSKDQLQPGDLVFFDTDRDGDVNHVGIYVGGGKFIHASSGAGKVTVSDLNGWYSQNGRYKGARRP